MLRRQENTKKEEGTNAESEHIANKRRPCHSQGAGQQRRKRKKSPEKAPPHVQGKILTHSMTTKRCKRDILQSYGNLGSVITPQNAFLVVALHSCEPNLVSATTQNRPLPDRLRDGMTDASFFCLETYGD